MEVYFILDATEVYKTKKRDHVLAGFKIFDYGTTFPGTNELIFQYEAENTEDGWGNQDSTK